MPTSTPVFKDAIYHHIRWVASKYQNMRILDVGPGEGTYGKNLGDLHIDAIEIHGEYISEFGLANYYKNVFHGDILNFDYTGYDYIIMGDVLEHIDKEAASDLIKDISDRNIKCIIGVPFHAKQGSEFFFNGKEWNVNSEIHHQDDLNEEIMGLRYPTLSPFLIFSDAYSNGSEIISVGYGYYTNYLNWIF